MSDQVWSLINVYNFENGLFSIVVSPQKWLANFQSGKHVGNVRIKHFQIKKKRQYPPHYWSDKGLKGTIVNQAFPFLHGGSL